MLRSFREVFGGREDSAGADLSGKEMESDEVSFISASQSNHGEQCAGKQSCAAPVPKCFSQLYTSHNWLSNLDYQLLILDIKLQSSRDLKS